jgi:hypothetical protein
MDYADFYLPEFKTLTFKSDYFIISNFDSDAEYFFLNLN